MSYDVVVIGGGPAGSTVSALLARRGRKVLLLEQDEYPRFRIGESLLPMSCEMFDKLGLTEEMERRFMLKYGARFVCSETGRVHDYLFADAFDKRFDHSYQVQRAEFDQLMLSRAAELGAEVRQPWRVTEVLFEGERAVGVRARPVAENAEEVVIRAPFVVDGSGRSSLLASRFGTKRRIPGLDQVAMYAHYQGVPRDEGIAAGHIWIIVYPHGWIWMIPFKNGITSVGAVATREWLAQRGEGEPMDAFFDRTLALSPPAMGRLTRARRINEVRTAADFSYSVSRFFGEGWLCIGDSCGFIDPLFSTGAHLALKGSELAADAIDRALDDPGVAPEAFAHYQEVVRSAAGMFLGAVQSFYAGGFRDLVFEEPQRKTIRQIITSMLSGDVFHPERPPQWVPFVRERYPATFS